MSTEIWKPIPDYPGYEASNLGQIRSLKNSSVTILKQSIGNRYFQVGVAGKPCRVHTLVTLAFLGPRPEGLEVCHNDGDRKNNRINNLRYDTHSANMKDAASSGVMGTLSRSQVVEIKHRFANGESYKDLANFYGLHRTTISHIINDKLYT